MNRQCDVRSIPANLHKYHAPVDPKVGICYPDQRQVHFVRLRSSASILLSKLSMRVMSMFMLD